MASYPFLDPDLTRERTPDVMNDPAYTPNAKDEPDTCRICRSEGTAEEPLFYPCKCSGSIKFVHQDCLMEWLSHSQKKHCELCKTRFRFTKLYHPQMPPTLPATVFLRKAAAHLYKNFITWCRALLVIFIWLFWLPWSIRLVWRGLFWLGDEGWVREYSVSEDSTAQPAGILGTARTFPEAVASATAVLTNQFANASDSFLQSWRNSISQRFTQNLSGAYHSTAHDMMSMLLSTFGTPLEDLAPNAMPNAMPNTTSTKHLTRPVVGHSQTSLLSGFPILQNLTRWPRINATIIDVFEGQVITLSVVFIFVLIFLIREWVVGQQPLMNMAAAGARMPAVPAAAMDHDQHQDPLAPEAARAPVEEVENEGGNEVHGLGLMEENAASEPDAPRNTSSPINEAGPMGAEQQEELASLRAELRQTWESLSPEERQALDQDKIDQIHQILRHDGTRAPAEDDSAKTLSTEFPVSAEPSGRATSSASLKERPPSSSTKDMSDFPRDRTDVPTNWPVRLRERSPTAEVAERLNATEETESAGKEGTMSRPRPPMPQRSESFKATAIQRELEELLRDGPAETGQSKPTAVAGDESDGEQSGGEHSEGWQRIDTPSGSQADTPAQVDEGFTTGTAPVTGSAASGKEKMTEEIETEPALLQSQSTQISAEAPLITSQTRTNDDRLLTESLPLESQINDSPVENPFGQPGNRDDAPIVHGDPLPAGRNDAGPPDARGNAQDDGLVSRLIEWLWGDVAPLETPQNDEPNDEHIIVDLAEEAPFVPFADAPPLNGEQQDDNMVNQNDNPLEANVNPDAEEVVQDPEVVAAARAAGIDPVEDDAEDLEGLMEIFGMQGPIMSLVQNAIFGVFLVAITVTVAVWLPYIIGKIVLVFLGNPVTTFIRMPVQLANGLANLCIDLAVFFGSLIIYWTDSFVRLTLTAIACVVPWFERLAQYDRIATLTRPLPESAFRRVGMDYNAVMTVLIPDVVNFSWRSLSALRSLQNSLTSLITTLKENTDTFYSEGTGVPFAVPLRHILTRPGVAAKAYIYLKETVANAASGLWLQAKLGTLTVSVAQEAGISELSPPFWTVTDRLIAILTGYGFFAVAGAVYLSRGRPITSSQRGIRIEGVITEMLQQAGGILKVIFIIGIEMIVFPLYCGLLLDFALLPLFEGATFSSGFMFMISSPWTSGFAHWFVGTCYMFHFALFVSMCRRILRKGVLHFIRDPDDPSFHPVRDVLEKSVTSQLRKIAFSAVVYGALVIIGLGIVVWSLFFACPDVFPIQWRSHELVLEFPLDLLVYNILALSAPLLVVSLKPSTTLQSAYDWWMRKCARILRLSDFLFRQTNKDEQVGFDGRTWKRWRFWSKSEETAAIPANDERVERVLPQSGRFVRTPASDHVRLQRGRRIFVEVDSNNERLDGLEDPDRGPQGRNDTNYTIVYVPPWFRVRLGLFLGCLWVFSAGIGLLVTILPLVFGRRIFRLVVPEQIQMNDIYAFGIGSFTLGSLAIATLQSKRALNYIRSALSNPSSTVLRAACSITITYTIRALRVLYTYTAFAVFIPSMLALLLEFYVILPLHTYMGSGSGHIIHAIQDWTLGVLYSRIVLRIILDNQNSRPARVLAAVMRDGYLNPNARLATRCFLLPLTVLIGIVLAIPLPVGYLANKAYFRDASPTVQTQVYRYAYPAVAAVAFATLLLWRLGRATARWRRRIRDEVYLIGERLHNFGEARARPEVAHGARRIRT